MNKRPGWVCRFLDFASSLPVLAGGGSREKVSRSSGSQELFRGYIFCYLFLFFNLKVILAPHIPPPTFFSHSPLSASSGSTWRQGVFNALRQTLGLTLPGAAEGRAQEINSVNSLGRGRQQCCPRVSVWGELYRAQAVGRLASWAVLWGPCCCIKPACFPLVFSNRP